MSNHTDVLQQAGESFEYANQYVQKQIELLKLEGAERVAKTTATLITTAVLFFFVSMVVLMLSLSLGFFLGNLLNSYALSFLIIAGIYAAIGLLVYFFKNQLLTNHILTHVLESLFD